MKDTYGKRTYKCNYCEKETYNFVWESEINNYKIKCFQCAKMLGYDNLKKKVDSIISIRTPTKNR